MDYECVDCHFFLGHLAELTKLVVFLTLPFGSQMLAQVEDTQWSGANSLSVIGMFALLTLK